MQMLKNGATDFLVQNAQFNGVWNELLYFAPLIIMRV